MLFLFLHNFFSFYLYHKIQLLWKKAPGEDETVHNSPVWPGKGMWKPESRSEQLESTLSQGRERKLKAGKAATTAALQPSRCTWKAEDITTHTALLRCFPRCTGSEINDTSAHGEGLFHRLGYFK